MFPFREAIAGRYSIPMNYLLLAIVLLSCKMGSKSGENSGPEEWVSR